MSCTASRRWTRPAIESAEVLLAKGGGETEKQIYRFTKGESDLALRFDLTVPLAKYVAANYGRLAFPFRRYQIGKVWRGERAQRGRFREFYQADIDVIGDGRLGIMNDAEMPAIICPGLHRPRARGLHRPHQQPQGAERLFRAAGRGGADRRRAAHGGQAGEDRSRQGARAADGRVRPGREERRRGARFRGLRGHGRGKARLPARARRTERKARRGRGRTGRRAGRAAAPGRAGAALPARFHHRPRARLLHGHGV